MANTVTIKVEADTTKAEANVKGMGGKMQSAMKGVAVASGALTLAAGAAAALGQEYQEATNTIAAGTGASGEQLEGLNQSFKNVWGDVPQDAAKVSSVIADLNTELALEGAELEDVSKAFLDVSRAMGEDANPMIKAVADSMVAFGVPASETRSQLDKLTAVSQAVGVPMTALADTVVKFGPQLQTLGLSLDEATALVGNMEAAGLSASKMMPGLNTAIGKLAKEGVTDISAGLQEMVSNIENAETDTEALALATSAFGAGAGIRFKDAIDKGVFSLDEMLAAMENSEGKMAELGASTLTTSEKFDMMKNNVKSALAPIGNFATALGPMVIMIPALTTGISAMAASQTVASVASTVLSGAMALLNLAMGPIGLIVLGLVAAIAAVIVVWKNWDTIVEKATEIWANLKNAFEDHFGWLLPGGSLESALEAITALWDTVWSGLGSAVSAGVSMVKAPVNDMIGLINAVISGLNKIAFDIPGIPGLFEGTKFGMNIPLIPELAKGGIVRKPTLAMLGEAGPELVTPLNRSGGLGAPVTMNINLMGDIYGMDDFEDRVSEAVRDGARRGGFDGILLTT